MFDLMKSERNKFELDDDVWMEMHRAVMVMCKEEVSIKFQESRGLSSAESNHVDYTTKPNALQILRIIGVT